MVDTARRHIGIVLVPDVEELDAVGPWEVLASWCTTVLEDRWQVACLSAGGGRVVRGQPATTHWAAVDLLGQLDPSIEGRRGIQYHPEPAG